MKSTFYTLVAGATLYLFTALPSFSQSTDCKPVLQFGKTAFCEGDTTLLHTTPARNTTYRWFRDTTLLAGATTASLIVDQPGAYRLEATRKAEEWVWGLNGGPENDLNDIQFRGTTGWIVGNDGTLLKTTNGSSWDTISVSFRENFTTVFFLNDQLGWIGGSKGLLLKSVNGGISWQRLTLPDTGAVQKIHFFNENTGYVQATQKLFRTSDGGTTWTKVTFPVQADVKDFAFVNLNVGWVGLSNQIYKTENGGTSWALAYTIDRYCDVGKEQIYALDSTTCWIGINRCNSGYTRTWVIGTTDGGRNWSENRLFIPLNDSELSAFTISEMYFTDARTGYLIGSLYRNVSGLSGVSGGAVFKTTNGGQTWQLSYENVFNGYPAAMAFISPSKGVIAGKSGLLWQLSDSAGVSTPYTSRTYLPLQTIGGTSQKLFVGGGIPRPGNGGVHPDSKDVTLTMDLEKNTWQKNEQLSPFYNANYGYTTRQIKFKTDQLGWKAGFSTLTITTDGGQTWKSVINNNGLVVQSLMVEKAYLKTETTGWMIARSLGIGVTYLSRISEGSFTSVPVPHIDSTDNKASLLDMQFINDNVGFISTSNGRLIRTTDGGTTWTVQTVRVGKSLQRVFFVDEQQGWVVSNDGSILRTKDGGTTWVEQSSGITTSLNGLYFTSSQEGYAVGEAGVVLKTINAGDSWEKLSTTTRLALYDVYLTKSGAGWAVGDKGVILRLASGNCQSTSEPVVIKVNARPAKPTISASGDMKLVSSAAAGNQWYLNEAALSGATGKELSPTQAGRYTVQVIQEGCNSALSDPFEYVITAIDPAQRASLTLYPNPTAEQVFVSLKGLRGLVEVELLSPEGRSLSLHRLTSSTQESILPLELKGLASGTYIVRVRSGTFAQSSKVILNR